MMLVPEPPAIGAETKEAPTHIESGTLIKLDLSSLRGLLTTDLGRPVFFDVPKAYLFENVIVGARITVQLDQDGQAIKVMDTALPDMVLPAATFSRTTFSAPLAISSERQDQDTPNEDSR
jgi:hypothetical protein